MAERLPSDIARDTLKLLVTRRLAPTPDNYRALYDEISGASSVQPFPEAQLHHIMRLMPGQTPAQKRLLGQFERAVDEHDWVSLQSVMVAYANLGLLPAAPDAEADGLQKIPTKVLSDEFALALRRLIDHLRPVLGEDDTRTSELADQLVDTLRQPLPLVSTVQALLHNFSYRLSFTAEEQAGIRASLLLLLQLVVENIGSLTPDDRWLKGQTEALLAATQPPVTLRRLDEVQRLLRDVIFKQTESMSSALEAQEDMKEMLSTFIERLSKISASSSTYQDTLERCADMVGKATTLQDIGPMLQDVMGATRAMALDSRVTHEELNELRERSQMKHAEVLKLQQELELASAQARHDPLTGSLNRKGLDEAVEREIARAQRQGTTLCVALLDVDNFKTINDRLGHTGGDAALIHLAQVTRDAMRPQDLLARYGGEEFVLVLPDTSLEDAIQAMTRVQRELSTRLFLQGSEKVLITFSAGVAQLHPGEDSLTAIRRADAGMYMAKRSGKNRVVAA